jgi:hypothetical protein
MSSSHGACSALSLPPTCSPLSLCIIHGKGTDCGLRVESLNASGRVELWGAHKRGKEHVHRDAHPFRCVQVLKCLSRDARKRPTAVQLLHAWVSILDNVRMHGSEWGGARPQVRGHRRRELCRKPQALWRNPTHTATRVATRKLRL